MSSLPQRDALATLSKKRLVELASGFEVDVPSRAGKDEFVDALAQSRRVSYEGILDALSRDELKAICRAGGLDDSGRTKASIADRILGREQPGDAGSVPAAKAGRGRSRAKAGDEEPEQIELPTEGKLTVTELEKHLWSAADILRGSIDSSDYKSFIFGMLFLKRLSDRFEEEAQKLVEEGEDKDVAWNDPDEHQFFVPEKARWSAIQATATNVGTALNKACAALEEANSASLEGVLLAIDFNDPNRLGDTKNRDTVLGRLVQHFSRLNLRNDSLSEPDMLGRAYEYLIERFADDAGKKGGEFYTPHKVVELIVELLQPKEGMRICDPTCGSGGMLVQCATYVARHGGNQYDLTLHGQEKNLGTWGICKMNMLLHSRPSARIEKGDTIRDPKLVEDGELILYDRVIANPPFSLDEWGREVAEADKFGRFRFGVPPKTKGDLAFVQHMAATINDGGKVGVVMPHGVLFRGAAEGSIREGMLREDLFEAVIGLPPNLFYGTGIPAAVLVLSRKKGNGRKGKVLFIDASGEFKEGSNQNYLREQEVKKIAKTFHAYKDVEKYARVVDLEEIEKNDFNLNISRYVDTSEAEEKIDVATAVAKLRELETARAEAQAKMNGFLEELGYG
ncbi:MAG: type I restriction-modification system subunit M [Nannocystaceae bacterium]|nr:type I restriction-modification system subunit M [bacterium]